MPASRRQVYKCMVCGIVAEVLDGGAGEPVCCGQKMTLCEPNAIEAQAQQHELLCRRDGQTVEVRVGGGDHPSDRQHHIQWIECFSDDRSRRVFLGPDRRPVATFGAGPEATVRAFCTQHGLWEARA
jgi:superoxide reductase